MHYNFALPPGIVFKGMRNGLPIFVYERLQIPNEFDFFNEWCGKDLINAKEYYKIN